jgi:hypothetical protein
LYEVDRAGRINLKNGSQFSLELVIFFKVIPLAAIDEFTISGEVRSSRKSMIEKKPNRGISLD